ncbi:MAG: hypothetical protein HRU20_04605 [Pseudomonadales bacterium]|nr:hypothetical protein [Pseudomonadales bacterium]
MLEKIEDVWSFDGGFIELEWDDNNTLLPPTQTNGQYSYAFQDGLLTQSMQNPLSGSQAHLLHH